MSKKSNLLGSVLGCKCPKCHEGDLFLNKKTYQFKDFLEMPNRCAKCNQDFQIEAGFYLGAMFVSYALTVALCIAVFVAFITISTYKLVPFLITVSVTLVVTTPIVLRISRSIWIYMSIRYDPNAISDYEQKK